MFACAFQAGAPSPSHLAETPCPIEESMLDACGGVFSLATPDSTRTPYALGKEWCSGAVLAQKVVLASSSIGCACAEVGHDTSFRTATLAPFLTCSTYSVVLHANNHNSLATLVIRNWTTLVWSCPLTISPRSHRISGGVILTKSHGVCLDHGAIPPPGPAALLSKRSARMRSIWTCGMPNPLHPHKRRPDTS